MTVTDPGHIDVQVRLFGRYRSLLPDGCTTIALLEGCRVSDLITELGRRVLWPDPKSLGESVAEGTVIVLINGRHVLRTEDNPELNSGDAVVFLSPVAGGSETSQSRGATGSWSRTMSVPKKAACRR